MPHFIWTTVDLVSWKYFFQDMEKGMKRTEQMLHWLEGGSEKQFVDFCGALEDCKQSFIVTEYLTPKNKEAKIPESNIPEPKITEHVHVIPESNISHPDPPVIQKNPMKSPDVCRDSEGDITFLHSSTLLYNALHNIALCYIRYIALN